MGKIENKYIKRSNNKANIGSLQRITKYETFGSIDKRYKVSNKKGSKNRWDSI